MFEKEANEYESKYWDSLVDSDDIEMLGEAFKDGAEFGYNKAKEWHYVKDGDFPKEMENVLCYCRGPGIKFCCVGHTIVGGDKKTRWWANNKSEELIVIKWKEIILEEEE